MAYNTHTYTHVRINVFVCVTYCIALESEVDLKEVNFSPSLGT